MGTTSPARVSASQFSGTGQYTNLVPESWYKETLRHFDANTVFSKLVDYKYEKTIKQKGDTIYVRKTGNATLKNYERNQDTVPEDMTSEMIQITIDQQKYWDLIIDDLDSADMDIDIMSKTVTRAGVALAQAIDDYIMDLMIDGASADNSKGTVTNPIALDPDNIYATLVELSDTLALTNTIDPGKNPVIVVPQRMVGLMRLAPEATHATQLGDKVVRTGDSLGTFAGFDVVPSRRVLPDTNKQYQVVMLASKEACAFAQKISKIERGRAPKKFADEIKALFYYGGQVIYEEMIGLLTCTLSYT